LERNGVLASWAVPKGIPDRPDRNRLAIEVDDHELDHIGFVDDTPVPGEPAGTIRKSIWDAGRYVMVREDEAKLVFDLHGARLHARYALIRTEASDWLLHLMDDRGDVELSRLRARPSR
jgi:bifunctional non-homologous end joining protein LigD